jgi:tryptophan-rich sensory protein
MIMTQRPFKWWHAALILVAANIVSAVPAGYGGDKIFYNSFARPAGAPPDWAFAPVWLFLNITSLIALYRIANSPASNYRSGFLVSETIGWILFAAFATVYFLLGSPVLGAIDAVLGLAAAVTSLVLSLRIDRTSALLIGFRMTWLLLASYVSVWIAANNADPLFAR